jgi:hypothetical protein
MLVLLMMQTRVVFSALLLVVAASAYDDGATTNATAVRARRFRRANERSGRVLGQGAGADKVGPFDREARGDRHSSLYLSEPPSRSPPHPSGSHHPA